MSFTHSTLGGYLDCFHLWAIVKYLWIHTWPLWISVSKFLPELMLSFLLGTYLRVELLGRVVALCLAFWRTARLFYKAAAPLCISTSQCMRFLTSPHPCQHLFLSLFHSRHPSEHKAVWPCLLIPMLGSWSLSHLCLLLPLCILPIHRDPA